jgi:cell division protein FtsQ
MGQVVRWGVPALAVLGAVAWVAASLGSARVLAVQHIAVRGTSRLASSDVESLVSGLRGRNILRVDLEPYRQKVLDSPWVADATVWRVLPSTIEVRVSERTPMAIARLGAQLYLVDNAGVVVDEYGPRYRDVDAPIVDGLVDAPVVRGTEADVDRTRLVTALLTALDARQDLRRRVSQIDVSNAHDAALMFDADPVWLHLGDTQFVERLSTYLELASTLRQQFHDMDYVDLRFGDRVYVHTREGSGRVARAE